VRKRSRLLELLTSLPLDVSTREGLAKLKTIAVRRGLWFKVLSALERAVVDLTLKVVERVRSSVLKEALKSIASKVVEALKSRSFKERAMAIGRALAERIAYVAERLGNKRAREWVEDPSFVMYLGVSWLNTPPMFRHAL
jgi:hypothetical protein